MHLEATFTSKIVLELIHKVQNVTYEKGYHLYTGLILTWTEQAGQKCCFITIHVRGSQESIPVSVLPYTTMKKYIANRNVLYLIKL
jgi:hypothetical protein